MREEPAPEPSSTSENSPSVPVNGNARVALRVRLLLDLDRARDHAVADDALGVLARLDHDRRRGGTGRGSSCAACGPGRRARRSRRRTRSPVAAARRGSPCSTLPHRPASTGRSPRRRCSSTAVRWPVSGGGAGCNQRSSEPSLTVTSALNVPAGVGLVHPVALVDVLRHRDRRLAQLDRDLPQRLGEVVEVLHERVIGLARTPRRGYWSKPEIAVSRCALAGLLTAAPTPSANTCEP